jgi:DNA polymerase III delta prime subunit
MRYHETTLNEYVEAVENYNLHADHPLLLKLRETPNIQNMIFYGPSGVGKYSQMLYLLSKKIDGRFKFQQKMQVQKDAKEKYTYAMSDIYFEIDMGLLGCNSKTLWHEIYQQILDIVVIKPKRMGIIVCKNFHLIHSELLDIFYSYIQQNNFNIVGNHNIQIKFVLMAEQLSFIPTKIVNNFIIIKIGRPTSESYERLIMANGGSGCISSILRPTNIKNLYATSAPTPATAPAPSNDIVGAAVTAATSSPITPQKSLLKMVCDNVIKYIELGRLARKNRITNGSTEKFVLTHFRDILYEILTYGLDICECIWYILFYFNQKGTINIDKVMMNKIYEFLKKFNNNYRPITHLEHIFLQFIINDVPITSTTSHTT